MKERRATDRFKPIKEITLAVEAEDQPPALGVVADISEGGVCATVGDSGLNVGMRVRLTLCFPNSRTVLTEGELRWMRRSTNSLKNQCGIRFEPGPWTDERLKILIADNATTPATLP